MDIDCQTQASPSSTGEHICDLCDCVRDASDNATYGFEFRPAMDAVNHSCSSVDQLSTTMGEELKQITASLDSMRQRVTELEREHNAIARRLSYTESAYEVKSLLYNGTKLLLDKVVDVLEMQQRSA
ncbi:uncharacterized protein KD926_002079 [Aspergillus affinis]|uniref:uncharacterized protein n=1 Tax=Aspergillus affinis TaxID=1070780 RepID=UPI0022FE2220|nr:uncharacterized protein KD926_002079 [Aspergillus affinis]KAI9036315.1 hypothetical protein KD926_002079 [Aspergillus affinis]